MIIDLGTSLFGNGYLFTELKENSLLIKRFGPIYIDFDEYPRYSGRTAAIFETNVNENIPCDHGYDYSSGKKICTWVNKKSLSMMKTCFPDAKQINQFPEST